jgi:hypothetical protein
MQICNLAMPSANKAAAVLKDSLAAPPDWSLLCSVVHLLKLVINAQCGTAEGRTAADQERVQSLRHSARSKLAACFAEVWFPAVRVQDAVEEATRAEDYPLLLQKAAGTVANHARFLEMFLV